MLSDQSSERETRQQKPPALTDGRFVFPMQLAADVLEHFTVGLHGLNQILHDLHNIVTSKLGSLFFINYRLPMQAAISPIDCMVFIMLFLMVIFYTSKV